FRLFDETRPQTPKFFLNEDAPVTVGLVIDSSGSMGHVRDRVIAAAAEFVESSNPEDEVFALVFNDNVQKALGGQFTSDPRVLRSALANARSEEHTSELQSRGHLVCRLLPEKKKNMV